MHSLGILGFVMFKDEVETLARLREAKYFTNSEIALAVFMASEEHQPILLEGPAGAGKTEMAKAVQRATKMKIFRLQCYEGITIEEARGSFSAELRELYIRLHGGNFEDAQQYIQDRRFFVPGPLAQALEWPERCILLIDEIDKVTHAFEALLLEYLAEWQLSVPGLGTLVPAKEPPFTVITANDERVLGFPLLRRCARIYIDHPTPEQEARIVASQTPSCPKEIHYFIAGFAQALREGSLRKPPSISEMIVLTKVLARLKVKEIQDDHKSIILPFIAKTFGDRKALETPGKFEELMDSARKRAADIQARDLAEELAKAVPVEPPAGNDGPEDAEGIVAPSVLLHVNELEGVTQ